MTTNAPGSYQMSQMATGLRSNCPVLSHVFRNRDVWHKMRVLETDEVLISPLWSKVA
jgi:hypothetical protein